MMDHVNHRTPRVTRRVLPWTSLQHCRHLLVITLHHPTHLLVLVSRVVESLTATMSRPRAYQPMVGSLQQRQALLFGTSTFVPWVPSDGIGGFWGFFLNRFCGFYRCRVVRRG